jgi:ribosomal protein S18 acetylase RimI-like enzyme
MIKRMHKEDVPHVVAVHLESFHGFFLSSLGARFLSLYYSAICTAPEGIAYVYLNSSGIPSGFVVGTTNPMGFYSRLLKRDWLRFSFASLGAICRNPWVIPRIGRAFFHPSQNPSGEEIAGLYSIGVRPELRGTGAGKMLVEQFLKDAGERGCNKVFLTTDRDNNESINAFYQKLGFNVSGRYVTREGRRMNEYQIEIHGQD